jgi:hypothetical protein
VKRLLQFALALACAAAQAQDKPAPAEAPKAEMVSPIGKYILDAFKTYNGNTLCSVGSVPVGAVEDRVRQELKLKAGDTVSQEALQSALWQIFPCPFSPYRPELLPATAKDIAGAWLFPYDSQPYRFGAASPRQPASAADAVACEVFGFYPGGEMRTGRIMGANSKCPFTMATDLDPARKRPRVQNWAMKDGHLRITRSDDKNYSEEWDLYQVTRAFQSLNMEIRAGDLVAFKRREKGLDPAVSTEFLHLQRLP